MILCTNTGFVRHVEGNYEKTICACLIFLLMVCVAVTAYATDGTDIQSLQDAKNKVLIERFFSKQYTVYGKNGENITNDFYTMLTPEYENGNYDIILDYLEQHVSYAEASETVVMPIAPNSELGLHSSYDNIRVTKDFYQVVDDEIHGYAKHNQFYGTVVLNYVANSNEGEIISASAPTVTLVDLNHHYGDGDPVITVSNRRAVVASNKLSVTFSFHLKGEIQVVSDIYSEIDAFSIAYRYNTDIAFTEYAP